MKKLIAAAALAAAFAGCSEKPAEPTEAELFGYKGQDLKSQEETMFFTTGPGVTNWVPSRVLNVYEHYEFTSNELALIESAGIITPSKSYERIPEGFSEKAREPWFTTFTKDVEAFGKKGVTGFIAHYDDGKKLWETGETYFSTYYDAEADALKALNELEPEIAKFAPKKYHRFDKCWVAEYVRLRVMALVGQRPDGKWTCMLDIQDKCTPGCGQWEPVEQQQERVDEIAFKAETRKWQEAVAGRAEANHKSVLEKIKAAGIPMFGEEVQPQATGDGRMVYVRVGSFPMSNVVQQAAWDEKAKALETATTAKLAAVTRQDYGEYNVWFAMGTNELFTIRLDMAFPKPSTNAVEGAGAPGEFRQLCFENILPGNEPPPQPQRKRR